jgi:hypothetical protein
VEYLEYNERQTRTGEDVRNVRDSKPRMYAVPDISTCSVKMYKAYKARGPSDFCSSDKPKVSLIIALICNHINLII